MQITKMPKPQVRKLLIRTRKMWGARNIASFHTGSVLCPEENVVAEDFCFQWVKQSREKRQQKAAKK